MEITGSGIARVGFYTASGPVQTCDRCNAAIRHIASVVYRDGSRANFGLDCINRVLAGDTSLRRLFSKNSKLAEQYRRWLEVLSLEPEQMPRGSEYYGSGLYFVGDGEEDITAHGRFLFHPLPDWDKNQGGDAYVQTLTPEAFRAKQMLAIVTMRQWLATELDRIETFLGRVLAKAAKSAAA